MPSSNQGGKLAEAAWADMERTVQSGNLEEFKRLCFLVESHPCPIEQGYGALGYAVFHSQLSLVEWWIEEYASCNHEWARDGLIRSAIRWPGSCQKLLSLLSRSGCPLDGRDDRGKSLLHTAAWLGDTPGADFLLKAGVPTSLRDDSGWSPLRWAIRGDHREVVELLLRRNADPYSKCPQGLSDAQFAQVSGQPAMVERFKPFVEHEQLNERLNCENDTAADVRRL